MQAILALNLPNNVKELRHFLGMVQYYRDMWARRSEMLAPLTDLVGECGETKTTRMNKTKKKPWRWDLIHQQAFDNIKAAISLSVLIIFTIVKIMSLRKLSFFQSFVVSPYVSTFVECTINSCSILLLSQVWPQSQHGI
jgi:hypothetical protein